MERSRAAVPKSVEPNPDRPSSETDLPLFQPIDDEATSEFWNLMLGISCSLLFLSPSFDFYASILRSCCQSLRPTVTLNITLRIEGGKLFGTKEKSFELVIPKLNENYIHRFLFGCMHHELILLHVAWLIHSPRTLIKGTKATWFFLCIFLVLFKGTSLCWKSSASMVP